MPPDRSASSLHLLVKFPTRGRGIRESSSLPDFFHALDAYHRFAEDLDRMTFVITCDEDDPTMNCTEARRRLADYPALEVNFGPRRSKVEAINADIEGRESDIILLASDDMIPRRQGYDGIIRRAMAENYPDLDGVLWFNDGNRTDLCTLSILGKAYYDRFGYLYCPEYQALHCDNEFTEVCQRLGKVTRLEEVIIAHEHPSYLLKGQMTKPEIHAHMDSTYQQALASMTQDHETYARRKSAGFGLDESPSARAR